MKRMRFQPAVREGTRGYGVSARTKTTNRQRIRDFNCWVSHSVRELIEPAFRPRLKRWEALGEYDADPPSHGFLIPFSHAPDRADVTYWRFRFGRHEPSAADFFAGVCFGERCS
jgi:hypothetical protein